MMPFYDPRFPGDGKASHFQLVLRRRPDGKPLEVDPEVREELSQIIAYLEDLRSGVKNVREVEEAKDGGASTPPSAPSSAPPPRLTLPVERNSMAKRLKLARVRLGSKFTDKPPLNEGDILQNLSLLTDISLFAGDAAQPPAEAKANEPAALPNPGEPAARKSALIPVSKPALPVPTSKRSARKSKWPSVLAGVALLAALGYAAFFWARPAGFTRENRTSAKPPVEEAVSAEALRTAELVLHSIQIGRLDTASGALADARKHGVVLPGLNYQAALVALHQGDGRTATEWVSQSIAAHEHIPECLYLRANSAGAAGDYAAVCSLFEEAAGYAAFSPRYYFFWAEALRRFGHSAQALAQFERALLCRPNSSDTDLIRFKMGLAQIEAGSDEKFRGELQSALAQETVSGDTLLLAAAVEINGDAYPAAAAYLQRAKAAMTPALLSARLRDFLFQSHARQPDLAAVWPATPPVEPAAPARARVYVLDPATRSLAEADPAVW